MSGRDLLLVHIVKNILTNNIYKKSLEREGGTGLHKMTTLRNYLFKAVVFGHNVQPFQSQLG